MEHEKAHFSKHYINFSQIIMGKGRDTENNLEGYMEGIRRVGEGKAGYGKVGNGKVRQGNV